MSHNTAPGKGGFFELENGEELFLTPDMIPEPPKHLMADNPYSHHDKRYKRWKSCAIGRYYKKMYKELVTAKNKEDFLLKAGDARDALTDPSAWKNYMEERELDIKRPVGRPRLPPEQRKSPKGKVKRSDLMKHLLSDHGITVNKNNTLEPTSAYEGWIFLPNGRVQFEDESSISVHAFLRDYG